MFDFFNFIRRKWREYSEATGQMGTVVDDLCVKPLGLTMSDFYNSLVSQQRINNIANWNSMSESELDFFGNKFFIPRIQGSTASGYIRIYFDSKFDFDLTNKSYAVSNTSNKYKITQPAHVSKNSFQTNDSNVALYYVDVQITAIAQGSSYNADIGAITQLTGIDFRYKLVNNPEPITSGSKHETNEEYYNRIIYSINDRSMMNKRSSYSKLPEFFPSINSMFIAGAGDRYMQRDLISGVDITENFGKTDFLGKIPGNNMVKNYAFWSIFPGEVGGVQSTQDGPFSVQTEHPYQLSIDPIDISDPDPAFRGYPLVQEATSAMYQGLYFDDYKTFMEKSTIDLFNIYNENIGLQNILPSTSTWRYGAHGKGNGDFGQLSTVYGNLMAVNIISLNNNIINLNVGAESAVMIAKDIKKRTGVKLTGKFVWPNNSDQGINSELQFTIGGPDTNVIDAFLGIGFGIRVDAKYSDDNTNNAFIYFCHSMKYDGVQIYSTGDDFNDGHSNFDYIHSLQRKEFVIKPGVIYEFEFIFYDNLRATVFINRLSETGGVNDTFRDELSQGMLSSFKNEIMNKDSARYGTLMKVTLDSESTVMESPWQVQDLKAFDIAEHSVNMLMAVNVESLSDPVSVYMRGYGSSSINNLPAEGYLVYIWDKESQSERSGTTPLSIGGWSQLDELSDPDGSKSVSAFLLSQDIQGLERYVVNGRYGKAIFIMVTTSGKTRAFSKYAGETLNDIQSLLRVDYIRVQDQNTGFYHSNNKADIYVSTIKNTENPVVVTINLNKSSSDEFFVMNTSVCQMPVSRIISVTIVSAGIPGDRLSQSDYQIIHENELFTNSIYDNLKIVLSNNVTNDIIVEYEVFPQIQDIQNFYNSTTYGKIIGDILVRHKYPCDLSIEMSYSGGLSENLMIDAVKNYVDDNNSDIFSITNFISFLYSNNYASKVTEPLTIFYTKQNDNFEMETGSFDNILRIRPVDVFRIVSLTVTKI